jgi:hypothetical protein
MHCTWCNNDAIIIKREAVTTVSTEINSNPPGAEIFIDGLNTGQITSQVVTSPTVLDLTAGQHTYLLRLSGYQDISGLINIAAGNYYVVNAVMKSTAELAQADLNNKLIKLGYVGIAAAMISLIIGAIKRK